MRTYLSVLALGIALALASCGESNLNKANGRWRCDPQASIALLDGAAKAAAGIAPALAEGVLKNMEFSLDAKTKKVGGSLFGIGGNADFSVVSDSGSSLVIKSGDNTLHLMFRDKDNLELSGGPIAQKFVFRRLK